MYNTIQSLKVNFHWVVHPSPQSVFWGWWGLRCSMRASLVPVHGLGCPAACWILVPEPGIEPTSPALDDGFLTTGTPQSVFITLQWNPISVSSHSPPTIFLQPFSPRQHQFTSCLWICLLWIFHVNGLMQNVTCCIWLPSLSAVFLMPSDVKRVAELHSFFHGQVIYMDIPHFVYPFISWWTLLLFSCQELCS